MLKSKLWVKCSLHISIHQQYLRAHEKKAAIQPHSLKNRCTKQSSAQAQQFPVNGKTHLVQVTSCQQRVIRTIGQEGIIYIAVQSLLSCASQLLQMQKKKRKRSLLVNPLSRQHSAAVSTLPLPTWIQNKRRNATVCCTISNTHLKGGTCQQVRLGGKATKASRDEQSFLLNQNVKFALWDLWVNVERGCSEAASKKELLRLCCENKNHNSLHLKQIFPSTHMEAEIQNMCSTVVCILVKLKLFRHH